MGILGHSLNASIFLFPECIRSLHPFWKHLEAYRASEPADDARFVPGFAHALEHTGGYAPVEAKRVAGILLPKILPYDPTCLVSFADNSRTLADDSVDAFMALLTNGKVTEDKAGSHGGRSRRPSRPICKRPVGAFS